MENKDLEYNLKLILLNFKVNCRNFTIPNNKLYQLKQDKNNLYTYFSLLKTIRNNNGCGQTICFGRNELMIKKKSMYKIKNKEIIRFAENYFKEEKDMKERLNEFLNEKIQRDKLEAKINCKELQEWVKQDKKNLYIYWAFIKNHSINNGKKYFKLDTKLENIDREKIISHAMEYL